VTAKPIQNPGPTSSTPASSTRLSRASETSTRRRRCSEVGRGRRRRGAGAETARRAPTREDRAPDAEREPPERAPALKDAPDERAPRRAPAREEATAPREEATPPREEATAPDDGAPRTRRTSHEGGFTGRAPGTVRRRRRRGSTRAVDVARSTATRSVASYRRVSAGASARRPAAVRTARSTEVGTPSLS